MLFFRIRKLSLKLRLLSMSSSDAMNELLQLEKKKSMLFNCDKFPISFLSQVFLCNCKCCWVKKLNLIVHASIE